jgi:uncharacterized membrane protein YdfJ with MMPL/SSD domain
MFTEFMPVRMIAIAAALGVGIVAYVVVPVLLPAAMALLGRAGWWPTRGPEPVVGKPRPKDAPARVPRGRLARPHFPHRRPRPAH